MIDTHYDLLSIAYVAYLKQDYSYLRKISTFFNENNVSGVIANLYFMSEEEMINELHPRYYQKDVSVLEMFKKAKDILISYLPNTDILFSIEGADYINDNNELEALYNNGLNSLIIAWNTRSKYASGNRSSEGLTDLGRSLLNKATSLGIGIDVSHANKKTFDDIIDLVSKAKLNSNNVCCYASHSNSKEVCNKDRNLSDDQLLKLKNVDGQVGIFSNKKFIINYDNNEFVNQYEKENTYLNHIEHISNIIGKDNIMLATDDMDFCSSYDKEYGEVQIFDYSNLRNSIYNVLSQKYDDEEIYNMMYGTVKNKIFDKIRKNEK